MKHLIIIYQFCLEHYPKLRELAQVITGLASELARRLREADKPAQVDLHPEDRVPVEGPVEKKDP